MVNLRANRCLIWGLVSAGLVLSIVSLLYLATLDNGLRPGELTGGDLITHQYAQVLARPSNAPGYPLYTLGGWAWFHTLRTLLPQANPTALLASYSTLWALLALAVLFILLASVTRRNWLLSGLVTLLYAVTYFFWYYAVTTEQYTSAVLQTLLFVWLAWTWDDRQVTPAAHHRLSADQLLLLMALLSGIALAHLVTVLAILPPLAWFILSRQPGLLRQPRRLLVLAGVAALPLLSYLFIYVRGAQHPEWRGAGEWASTWQWFWNFVSTGQGRSELTWSLTPLWTNEWPALWWRELTVLGLVVGVIGWLRLGRRGMLLAGTGLIYLLFSFIDRLGNWYQVVMPVYALLALGIGAAADGAWRWAAGPSAPRRRLWVGRSLVVAVLIGSIVLLLARNFPLANQSNRPDDLGLQPGWQILAADPPAGAAILATQPQADALRYLGIVGGVRADVEPQSTDQARARLAAGQPVYVTLEAAPLVVQEVIDTPHWRAAAPGLLQLLEQPDIANVDHPARPVGDGLVLHDADAQWVRPAQTVAWHDSGAASPTGPALDVTLSWQALQVPQHDWSLSLRPTFAGQPVQHDGTPVQVDGQHPVDGQYPTSSWSAGERVAEAYRLALPAGAEVDGLTLVVYRVLADGSFDNLAEIQVPVPSQP